MKAYDLWENKQKRALEFWNSHPGKELEYCLVAQGFEDLLAIRYLSLFGSGFTVLKIIKCIKEEIGLE